MVHCCQEMVRDLVPILLPETTSAPCEDRERDEQSFDRCLVLSLPIFSRLHFYPYPVLLLEPGSAVVLYRSTSNFIRIPHKPLQEIRALQPPPDLLTIDIQPLALPYPPR